MATISITKNIKIDKKDSERLSKIANSKPKNVLENINVEEFNYREL